MIRFVLSLSGLILLYWFVISSQPDFPAAQQVDSSPIWRYTTNGWEPANHWHRQTINYDHGKPEPFIPLLPALAFFFSLIYLGVYLLPNRKDSEGFHEDQKYRLRKHRLFSHGHFPGRQLNLFSLKE